MRLTKRPNWLLGVAALLCVTSTVVSASAVPTDSAAELARAREVFRQGLALESARDWASALAKFREVAAVRSTAQVRFHIARCQEQLGQLNEALGAYELAMSEATGPDREEILDWAAPAVEAIRARIPKLVVTRKAGAEAVRVRLNGEELGTASIDTLLPLDPGGHELVLSEGTTERRVKIVLTEGEVRRFEIGALVSEASRAAALGTPSKPAPTPLARPVLPWVMFGVAGAGFASAGVFFVLKEQKREELSDACGGESECPSSAKSIHTAGERYALAANISAIVGGVAAASGVVLWLTRSKPSRADQAPSAGLSLKGVSIDGSGATLHGYF
jgi:hypothetical protein